mgnify:CR=1 FL=1
MLTIQGKGVSAGVGVGPLYFYRRATAEIKRYPVEDTAAERHSFKGAQTGAIEQLGVLAEQARKEAGDEAAMLFETHQMMAEDLDYEEAIEDRIVNQKMNAEAAVSDTSEQFAEMFASMDDAYMQARAGDVKDVTGRILNNLMGVVEGGGGAGGSRRRGWSGGGGGGVGGGEVVGFHVLCFSLSRTTPLLCIRDAALLDPDLQVFPKEGVRA